MPCCSSCSLPVQGHQMPTGPRCSILFNEAVHSSGMEPECTACQLPWSSHPRGKHIPKDCKFCRHQVQGELGEDKQEHQEEGDIHGRLSCITLENKAIKAQLSQLMELVHQLLPQPSHTSVQSREAQAASSVQQTAQPVTTSCQTAGLPLPDLGAGQDTRSSTGAPAPPTAISRQATTTAAPGQPFCKGSGSSSQSGQCIQGTVEPTMGQSCQHRVPHLTSSRGHDPSTSSSAA